MLTLVGPRPASEPPVRVDPVRLDWDARLSMDMIRQHTKTDDVPGISDDLLALYRSVAVEAAEHYTGLLLAEQRSMIEPAQGPRSPRPGRMTYRHRLRYPTADGYVYLYGGQHYGDSATIVVPPGTRTLDLPIRTGYLDLSNCCDPCSTHHLNAGMMLTYLAGFKDPSAVPDGVVLGMLQFITWVLEHPGDELLSMRNRLDSTVRGGGGVQGTNNIAIASGALDTWRQYDPEAI